MAWYARKLAKRFHLQVEIIEFDLRHHRGADFSKRAVQLKWLRVIESGRIDALLCTPPCSTFSRAAWANDRGPVPVRSAKWPRGFSWNGPKAKRKAQQGNILADFSFEAMRAQLVQPQKLAVMEQPEDLGKPRKPRIRGHRPASMWQFEQHQEFLQLPGVASVALAQIDFGSTSVKPTRLLLRIESSLHEEMYPGVPTFDADFNYTGPLPKKQGVPLIGKENGSFKTAAAAAWPPALCEWVATQFLLAFKARSDAKGAQEQQLLGKRKDSGETVEEVPKKRSRGEEDEDGTDPINPPVPGGVGPARCCKWKGHKVAFHDGSGLPRDLRVAREWSR